jgi:hypothetical protein
MKHIITVITALVLGPLAVLCAADAVPGHQTNHHGVALYHVSFNGGAAEVLVPEQPGGRKGDSHQIWDNCVNYTRSCRVPLLSVGTLVCATACSQAVFLRERVARRG